MGYTVFIGDVARDEYYSVERFPELGDKVAVEALPVQFGGAMANAASVYASYGGETMFLSALNPSDISLCEELQKYNIDTSLVQFDQKLPESKCMIFLSQGEHSVFIVSMAGSTVELTSDVQHILCNAEMIYSSYFELSRLRFGDLDGEEIVRQWHENGVKLVCDIDVDSIGEKARRFLPYTEILFMNKVGFKNLCGAKSEEEAIREIMGSGVKLLVVTLAEAGCAIYKEDRKATIAGIKTEVVDVTGAGDTFCSTFAYSYLKLKDSFLAGQFAIYAASLSIKKMGARSGAVGVAPVINAMNSDKIDTTPYESMFC